MPFVVIYDACVLFPPRLRDLLVRVAGARLVQAKWTDKILDECFVNIQRKRAALSPEKLARTRELMVQAVPDCMVTGYEDLISGLRLPDPDDRHVLAAAIRAGAQTIVTANLKDFPDSALKPFDLEALSPDDFVTDIIDLNPRGVLEVVYKQAASLKNPPHTVSDVLAGLRKSGLEESVAKLNELLERMEDPPSVQ